MQEIRAEQIKTLWGRSIWAPFPVLVISLNLAEYEDLPAARLQGIVAGLVQVLPNLSKHICVGCETESGDEQSAHGTNLTIDHFIQHVILEVQRQAGMEVAYGRTEKAVRPGFYHVIVGYGDAPTAKACVRLALSLISDIAQGEAPTLDLDSELSELRDMAQANMLGPSTQAIVSAAVKRGIPWIRQNAGALVQLGYGRYSKRIRASATSLTPSISSILASDKDLTKTLLTRSGIPVPRGDVVRDEESAWDAARALGCPVVVKPDNGNHGRGVSVNLTAEEHVKKAFTLARSISKEVIVEQYLEGDDYRLLVVGRKLIAAALRRPAEVTGDGVHSIVELVNIVNADPRRGDGHGAALTRIKIDGTAELTLAKQELTWGKHPRCRTGSVTSRQFQPLYGRHRH